MRHLPISLTLAVLFLFICISTLGQTTNSITNDSKNPPNMRSGIYLFGNLLSYYSFDGDVLDNYGSNDLTLYDNVIYDPSGKLNGCMKFTEGYLKDVDFNFPNNNDEFTLSFWMWVDPDLANNKCTPPGYGYIMYFRIGDGIYNRPFIGVNSSRPSWVRAFLINPSDNHRTPNYVWNYSQWHHVVYTYGQLLQIVYVDNIEVFSIANSDPIDPLSNFTIGNMGTNTSTRNYVGLLDEVGIWNRMLNADEVSTLYNNGSGISLSDWGVGGTCGDVNNDSNIDILDIVYLINYKYKSGPEPLSEPIEDCSDVNSDGNIDILDIVYLINYKYKDGSEPFCVDVTDIDGNRYQAVKICDQWWMAENLKVTKYRNGDPIPNVIDNAAWAGLTTGAYCEYDNDINNVETYGRLYNWYAVDDPRNIAPEGWHVPTDEELKQLEICLGMSQADANVEDWRGTDEGGKLKESGTIHWDSPNTGATNESGFTALSGAYRKIYGSFYGLGFSADFWSSTEKSSSHAWSRTLTHDDSDIGRISYFKNFGFSVRCVKD